MAEIDVNSKIRRNSNDFSFVDRLGSFINSYEFGHGYEEFAQQQNTSGAYIWKVLSAIGNDCAQTIYSNILNYIDNVANIDLCKVKALKSMADVLGVKYQIFDNLDSMPVEVLNTLDVMSVNKKYLLDSTTFCSAFREELSSYQDMLISSYSGQLTAELCAEFVDPSTGDLISSSSYFNEISTYVDFNNDSNVIEESHYGKFLKDEVYQNLLNHFIYLRYADRENGISDTLSNYIFEYMSNRLIGMQSTTDSQNDDPYFDAYDNKMKMLKIKFKVANDFDPVSIVDHIEYGLDSLDNYDDHQKQILQVELDRRADQYFYDKPYVGNDVVLGNSLTRYSYYREKKVKEYFDFVQTTYNNLIAATDIESSIRENPSTQIAVYDKDSNYFNLNQEQSHKLISYDRDTGSLSINSSMIVKIAELLANQTLEIADIREQLKIQMQRTYMKGTFLLLSYVINEYLKYNILDKYGDIIFTQDGSASLRDIMQGSISQKDNVQLIEYTDATEYYNISTPNTDAMSQNSALVNPRYWEAEYSKIGFDTKDIPLDQISAYYMSQMHLDKRNVTDTNEFLSILFDLGANSSFIRDNGKPISAELSSKMDDYTCTLPDGTYCKDPDIEKQALADLTLSAKKLNENIDQYTQAGFQLSVGPVSQQMADLSAYISSYYWNVISSLNEQTKTDSFTAISDNLDVVGQMSSDYNFIFREFTQLSVDKKYSMFLSSYSESAGSQKFIDRLSALSSALSNQTHGVVFDASALTASVDELCSAYSNLSQDFAQNTLELSVLDLWPSYATQHNSEITAQTSQLRTFLDNQMTVIDAELTQISTNCQTHLRNHLDRLLSYKNDVNSLILQFSDDARPRLVNGLLQISTLVDIELSCLSSDIGFISIGAVSQDNIESSLSNYAQKLVEKIQKLDSDYVQMQYAVSSDRFVVKQSSDIDLCRDKSSRISQMLSSATSQFNIQYIDNEFSRIENGFQNLKDQWSEFLNGYFYSRNSTLHDQFGFILQFVRQHCTASQQELLDKTEDIRQTYADQLSDLRSFAARLRANAVERILDSKEYVLSSYVYDGKLQYLDDGLNDVSNWLHNAFQKFDGTAIEKISDACVRVPEYILAKDLIDTCYPYLSSDTSVAELLPQRISRLADQFDSRAAYIEQNRKFYDDQKKMFIQYSGTELGIDPYFNHKNMTHPSYQIHPYLFNFIERTNIGYAIANSFHAAFSQNYEQELAQTGIDNIIGNCGNVINLCKHGMNDWTGYKTAYEGQQKESDMNSFTGLFYPSALDDFLDNAEVFVQKVQQNDPSSPYYSLHLNDDQLFKIADQLRTYQDQIREVAQRKTSIDFQPSLSNEFDIYKYGVDAYGNSLILLKSYAYLYEKHQNDLDYAPSYLEKKNTPGELWMRIKDHPIAFPAFDLRSTLEQTSQYNIKAELNKKGKSINGYISEMNDALADMIEKNRVKCKNVEKRFMSTIPNQYLRCFYDMEFEPTNRVLLLNASYNTGMDSSVRRIEFNDDNLDALATYANSSVIVAVLEQEFDYNQNLTIYSFSYDRPASVDNISNPGLQLSENGSMMTKSKCDFLGFAKSSAYIHSLFIEKQFDNDYSGQFPMNRAGDTIIRIYPVAYKFNARLYRPSSPLTVSDVKYNIFDSSYSTVGQQSSLFAGTSNVAIACDGQNVTIAYVSTQQQPVKKTEYGIDPENEPYLKNNISVVNYAEYSAMVEGQSMQPFGQNSAYPSSTAILQTQDDQHIVIYNSFDSFTSHIVAMSFRLSGRSIKYTSSKYYNLNTDIGFMPLFSDESGQSRIYNNSSLASLNQYDFQLQGPEKADENATPVIINPLDEKYGRVTEDYNDVNKMTAFNSQPLSILQNEMSASYTFDLRTAMSAIYDEVKETGDLVKYRYMLLNSKFTSTPIAKGSFDRAEPAGYFYSGFEDMDLLSGQEIIGPNGVSFQNTKSTNHIDGISSVAVKTDIDQNTLLPTSVSLTCYARESSPNVRVLRQNQFMLVIYDKSSIRAYNFYRLIQNSSSVLASILSTELSGQPGLSEQILETIDFSDIPVISNYVIPGTSIPPFAARSLSEDPTNLDISALLEFKYSEQNTIDAEFPQLDSEDIADDIAVVTNDKQYSYFFGVDSFDTIKTDIFKMKKYDVSQKQYTYIDVNTRSGKYRDFYNKALTIEASYNIENISKEDTKVEYGNVLYFNYKNYTDTPYISCQYKDDGEPPSWSHYDANASEIQNTYLVLRPGEAGRLDIMVDYIEFDKISQEDITQSVVGKESRVLTSYYLLNVSTDKPKFKISKVPFAAIVHDSASSASSNLTANYQQWYNPSDAYKYDQDDNAEYSIDRAQVYGVNDAYQYTGSEIRPTDLTVILNDKTLIQDVDYRIQYMSNDYINASSVPKTVRLVGLNLVTSYHDIEYIILPAQLDNAIISNVQDVYYCTGDEILISPVVTVGDKVLNRDIDYTMMFSPAGLVAPGDREIIVVGRGNYCGELRHKFAIVENYDDRQ